MFYVFVDVGVVDGVKFFMMSWNLCFGDLFNVFFVFVLLFD